MSLWRQIRAGLQVVWNRDAADRDLNDEAQDYLERLTSDLEHGGLAPEQARRAARLQMGSALVVRERVRDTGWESLVAVAWNDCLIAMRRLRRSPAFALTAVATLALGIGAAAAIFTIVDSVLLKPLPYPESERIVALMHTAPAINMPRLRMAPSLYFTYREEGRVFESLALWNGNRATVTGAGPAEQVPSLFVTPEFLHVLRVAPAVGRDFTANDGDPGAPLTAILSHGYWSQHFGAAADVVGRTMTIDGNAHEVIGILPQGFTFQDEAISLLLPRQYERAEVPLIQFTEDGIARLKPGVELDQANADIERCLPMAPLKFPMNKEFAANAFAEARIRAALQPLKEHIAGDIRNTLWILMSGVILLLLIASANVANLMLVRIEARQRELSVRAALGAGWVRLAVELLWESVLIAVAGCALGLMLASAALKVIAAAGVQLPRGDEIVIDHRTVLASVLMSLVAALLFGLFPALRYTSALQEKNHSARDRGRTRGSLVVIQVALTTLLLLCSGLMIRTLHALRGVDPGFSHPEQTLGVRISIPPALAPQPQRVMAIQEAVLERMRRMPGVVAVAVSNSLPLEGGNRSPIYVDGFDQNRSALPPVRHVRQVSEGFVASIGSRILAGHDFGEAEIRRHTSVAMISENMARELWGDVGAAVGKRVRESVEGQWREIVGVVADLRDDGLQRPAPSIVYLPFAGTRPRNVDILIRSPRAGSAVFVEDLRRVLASVEPDVPLANVRTLDSVYRRSMGRASLALALLGTSAGLSLLIGVIGIYGVVAYSVSRRRKDIGIRIALGARARQAVAVFVREGLRLSLLGTVLGVLLGMISTPLLRALLFGVHPLDPLTFTCVGLAVTAAAVLASWAPARRAAAVNPAETLRAD